MEYSINLKELSVDSAEIQGRELAIINKENNTVYLTSKPYINKLFGLMGYKNLNVIKILEEYAGKVVSSIGDISPYKLYIDDNIETFVVTNDSSINWVRSALRFLNEGHFVYKAVKHYDPFYSSDQIIVTNRFNATFAIYFGLYDECAEVYSLNCDQNGVITGIVKDGKFKFVDGQDSFDEFKLSVSAPCNSTYSLDFTLDKPVSVFEYINTLKRLEYVTLNRKHIYTRTEKSYSIDALVENLDELIDQSNELNWLQQRTHKTLNKDTFFDLCKLLSLNINNYMLRDFYDIYSDNRLEKSDMFCLE